MGHLQDVNQTYWQHFRRAIKLAFRFAFTAPLLLIHAFLPNMFTNAGSNAVDVYNQLMDDED